MHKWQMDHLNFNEGGPHAELEAVSFSGAFGRCLKRAYNGSHSMIISAIFTGTAHTQRREGCQSNTIH